MKDIRDWVDIAFKVVLAVVGSIVGYYFSFQKQQNDDIKLISDLMTSEQSEKRLWGASILLEYVKQKRVPPGLYVPVTHYANNGSDKNLQAVVNKDAAAISKEQPAVAKALTEVASNLPVRIYFHIRDEASRDAAKRLKTTVESSLTPEGNSIIVPGIELIPGSQKKSVLKCFKALECQTFGQSIVKLIADNGVPIELSNQSKLYEQSSSIRPNHFEVWFAENQP